MFICTSVFMYIFTYTYAIYVGMYIGTDKHAFICLPVPTYYTYVYSIQTYGYEHAYISIWINT